MSYQVPQYIDPNKVFLVNLSQLEGRLDPSVYKPHFSFVSKKYKNAKLSEIAWIDPLCNFGECNEVSFIPMDAIDSANGTVAYQGTKKVENSKGFTRFREGDILWAKITPCMQNAKSAIAKNLLNGFGCGSTEFYVIRTKDENIVRQEYLLFLLRDERILKTAMNFFGGSAGQQRVSSIFLKTFNVPIPSIQEQKNICDILAKYSSLKQQKEQQAKALLQSIDGYLLNELGIQLPKTKSQTIQDRMFVVNFSEVSCDRYDPKYNKNISYIRSTNSVFPWRTLDDVVKNNGQYGANESALDYNIGDIRYIRITDIDENGNLKVSDKKTAEKIDSSYLLNYNDVLFARSGSVGRCYIHKDTSEPAIFAGYLIRYELDIEKIIPDYLFYYCNSSIYHFWVQTIQRPAVQANINSQEFRKLPIPLPPLQKQKEIVDHISAIRQQAKALQEEGQAILEQAKKEIEQMILG